MSLKEICKIANYYSEEEYKEQEKQEKIKRSKCFLCDKQLWEPSSDISFEEKKAIRAEHCKSDCRR